MVFMRYRALQSDSTSYTSLLLPIVDYRLKEAGLGWCTQAEQFPGGWLDGLGHRRICAFYAGRLLVAGLIGLLEVRDEELAVCGFESEQV